MKNVAILFILSLGLQDCNFKEAFVHPFSITDSWRLAEYKRYPDSSWQAVNVNKSLTVRFKANGNIQYGNDESYYGWMPFRGGWCNHAEKYTLKDGRIYFEFGEPGCIPFFAPNTPVYGHILKLTKEELVIDWWGESWKFIRI
jgi:hypothetical protein